MPLAARLRSLPDDLRTVGPGAPVRAAYEVSKHRGGHRLLFGRLATSPAPVPSLVIPFPAVAPVPSAARERALAQAADVLDGRIELFGQEHDLGSDPDWFAVLHRPGRWPDAAWWWEVDIRSAARDGDVKWVWELGRHRHLVLLARAAHLEPGDERWAAALTAQLTSWLDATPPERGIHWYSNLEVALRAVTWLDVLRTAGDHLPPALVDRMAAVLHHSGRHLLADLPYSWSSMRNNHLLGDALGLSVLGRAFGRQGAAARWARLGDRLFDGQLRRERRPDGAITEDSVSYHRFVLEMVAVRVALDHAEGTATSVAGRRRREALADLARWLCRLGALDGPVPHLGDGDEGRVLAALGGADDLAGSVHVALGLAGDGATDEQRATTDEAAWWCRPGTPAAAVAAEGDGADVGGGVARATAGAGVVVWCKAGGGDWHGHADLTSVAVRAGDRWLVGDPGTGTYNGDDEQRRWFRSSISHSVLRLDGLDQREAHRAFRWRYPAVGAIGEPVDAGDALVVWGVHGSYTRLDPGRRVARVVIVPRHPADGHAHDGGGARPGGLGGRLVVADLVEGPPGLDAELSLPLGPGLRWRAGGRGRASDAGLPHPDDDTAAEGSEEVEAVGLLVADDGGTVARLVLPAAPVAHTAERDPFDGWWSPSYGRVVPATRLAVALTVDRPVVWSLTPAGGGRPGGRDDDVVAAPGDHRGDGAAVVVGDDLGIEVTWTDTLARLTVEHRGGRAASTVGVPAGAVRRR